MSDVAVVLVDARHGVVEQTSRHVAVSALLGVRAIVLAVNKMDLVGWDEETFLAIAKEVTRLAEALPGDVPVLAVPVSALHGDNVVTRSAHTPWYRGPALLTLLEDFPLVDRHPAGARLAVQWTIVPRNGAGAADRRLAGRLAGGPLAAGDDVAVLPGGERAKVAGIERFGREVERAEPGWAVAVRLDRPLDAGRGAVLVATAAAVPATVTTELEADVCWLVDRPLGPGSRWLLKHHTTTVRATVVSVAHRLDLGTLAAVPAHSLALNDLGRVQLRLAVPVVADRYDEQHEGGRFILVDDATNDTAAAGMVRGFRASGEPSP